MPRRALLLPILLTVGIVEPSWSQSCFRGAPAPACRGFTVVEFTGGFRVNAKPVPTDQASALFSWNFGYLQNVGRRAAVGAFYRLFADSDGHRHGPMLRYRRWTGARTSVDIGAGAYVGGKDNFSSLAFPAPSLDVAVNFGDRFGLAAGLDLVRDRDRGSHLQSHLGFRFGTWLAPVMTIGFGALLAASMD
jgi:hypothetical protein